jgi:hypothetical protein
MIKIPKVESKVKKEEMTYSKKLDKLGNIRDVLMSMSFVMSDFIDELIDSSNRK